MKRAFVGLTLVALAATGGACDSSRSARSSVDDSNPRLTSDKPKDNRVFDVKSSDDLLMLRTEYMGMWDSGFDGVLEVNVAAGTYQPVGWNLEPAPDSKRRGEPARIDVVLRGAPAALPTPGRIRARSLTLQDLILTRQDAVMTLEVGRSLTVRSCLFIDGRGVTFDAGSHLGIVGRGQVGGKPTPIDVTIEDSWFVRNYQAESPMSMMGLDSAADAPVYFDRVAIRRSAFLGNAFKTELDIKYAKSVSIEDTLFYKTWPDGVLLRCQTSADVELKNTVIVAQDIGHIAHVEKCPALAFDKSSRIYVTSRGSKPPASLAIDPGQILDRTLFEPNEGVAVQAAGMPAGQMPAADLKKRLDAAFRP